MRVDLTELKEPGTYPSVEEKVTLELAREIHRSDPNAGVAISWPAQQEAMDYFNKHGFTETLDRMLKLREENERRTNEG